MAEIFKALKKSPAGFALIAAALTLTLLMMLGTYLISFETTENKISQSQSVATKNYYLAEAGINEMIYKIKNDPTYKPKFLTGELTYGNDHFSRSNVFGDSKAGYTVAAQNTLPAEAQIIATSTYQIYGYTSQRVVKAYVVRATGSGYAWQQSLFAGGKGTPQNGNITVSGAGVALTANDGRVHANQNVKAQGGTVQFVVNDGAVTASNNILEVSGGRIILNNSYSEAPTSTIDMPQIDFDSTAPTSWKNRATATYSSINFKNLPNNTTLTGIIYVNGDADWSNKNLTINGVLVANGEISFNTRSQNITLNYTSQYGAGILAKEDLEIEANGSTYLINGLLYTAKQLDIAMQNTSFTINGAFVSWDAQISASGNSLILNFNTANIATVLDPALNTESPIIQINHWEEQY